MSRIKSGTLLFIFSVLFFHTALGFQPRCGWYIAVEPFYAKATDTLLTNSLYAVKVFDPAILGDFRKDYFLRLDNSWGARVAVGYDFHCCRTTCDGVSLEYTFFNHTNNARVRNDSRDTAGKPVIAPAEFIDITSEDSARFSDARSSLSQKYDTFDLLAHRKIFLCGCSCIDASAGFRYFHLDEHLHNRYKFTGFLGAGEDDPPGSILTVNTYNVNFKNDLNAIGPHVGTRIFYNVICGFGFSGEITGSLLFGESWSEFKNFYSLIPGGTVLGDETILSSFNHHDNTCHVVPALSGKVAINYQARLLNCSTISFELGYRGDKYFNACNDVAFQQLIAGDDINSNSNYHDFDLSGPYFSISFHA